MSFQIQQFQKLWKDVTDVLRPRTTVNKHFF